MNYKKVAIVHDWFVGGGAERVVLELHRMYPKAPIYTSYCSDEWREKLDGMVRTGYLQYWPFSKLRKFLPPLRALWFSRLNLGGYDLVISSSGAEAKFVRTKTKMSGKTRDMQAATAQGEGEQRTELYKDGTSKEQHSLQRRDVAASAAGAAGSAGRQDSALHISYIHAPTHYYWSRYDEYIAQPGFGFFDPLARIGLKILVGPMRRWDFKAAQRPDFLIANSNYTKEQIEKYYQRDSVVIHPPVDVERFNGSSKPDDDRHGFVVAGRQTPYKKIDLAVEAAAKLDVPLIVIGRGPEHRWLKKLAGRNVTFLTKVTDEDIPTKFGEAKAFIFPGIDDFGIVAVEAMAAGTPIIAYKAGGALDFVNSKTGIFFDEQTAESLAATIGKLEITNFNHSTISAQTAKFSSANFQKNLEEFIKSIA